MAGSVIVSPDSRIIAGPLGNEEDILYADLDLEIGVKMKLRHDFAGHYNRPDIFQVRINTAVPQMFGVQTELGVAGDEPSGGIIAGQQMHQLSSEQPALELGPVSAPRALGPGIASE